MFICSVFKLFSYLLVQQFICSVFSCSFVHLSIFPAVGLLICSVVHLFRTPILSLLVIHSYSCSFVQDSVVHLFSSQLFICSFFLVTNVQFLVIHLSIFSVVHLFICSFVKWFKCLFVQFFISGIRCSVCRLFSYQLFSCLNVQ